MNHPPTGRFSRGRGLCLSHRVYPSLTHDPSACTNVCFQPTKLTEEQVRISTRLLENLGWRQERQFWSNYFPPIGFGLTSTETWLSADFCPFFDLIGRPEEVASLPASHTFTASSSSSSSPLPLLLLSVLCRPYFDLSQTFPPSSCLHLKPQWFLQHWAVMKGSSHATCCTKGKKMQICSMAYV